jgi:hypothetical protein
MPRQAGDLAAELGKRAPARRAELRVAAGDERHLLGHLASVPAFGDAGEPLELRLRKTERLAEVANRPARAVGGEARDKR